MEVPQERSWSQEERERSKLAARRQPSSIRSLSTRLSGTLSIGPATTCRSESNSFASVPEPITAKPQTLDGEPVWPEHWGITPAQIKGLLARIRAEPDWSSSNNVHTLVHGYIIPWTRGTGLGYALSVNSDDPKEVTVMVSHAWSENAEEFLETLLRTCGQQDVLFVCALSLYQCEDAAGPSIVEQLGTDASESPFRRILEHVRRRGEEAGWPWRLRKTISFLPSLCVAVAAVLFFTPLWIWDCMALSHVCAAYEEGAPSERGTWSWRPLPAWPLWTAVPLLLLLLAPCLNWAVGFRVYPGRMVVALNREVDIYTRLWCVYEIFVAKHLGIPVEVARSLAAAGKASVRLATCSSQEDTERIRREIVTTTTYDAIDTAVFITAHQAQWKVVLCSVCVGSAIACFDIIFGLTLPLQAKKGSLLWLVPHHAIFAHHAIGAWCFALLVIIGKSTAYWAMLSLFSANQGVPTYPQVRRRGQIMVFVGSPVFTAAAVLCLKGFSGPVVCGIGLCGLIWAGYGGGFWAYALVLLYDAHNFKQLHRLCGIVFYFLVVFFVAMFIHLHKVDLYHHAWATPDSRAQLYRLLVNSLALGFGSIFLPTYIFWHTAHWWGFQVTREAAKGEEPSRLGSSDSEGLESLESGESGCESSGSCGCAGQGAGQRADAALDRV